MPHEECIAELDALRAATRMQTVEGLLPMLTRLRAVCVLAWLAAATAGCVGGQTGSESPAVRGPTPECSADSQCAERLEIKLARLRAPRAASTGQRVLGAECMATPGCGNLSATSCVCTFQRDPTGASMAWLLGGNECALRGRANDCLWPAAELAACTPGGCECGPACARALELLAADDARTIAAQARLSRCAHGACEDVIQLPSGCYSGDALLPEGWLATGEAGFSCEQSDADLLASSQRGSGEHVTACGVGGGASTRTAGAGGAPASAGTCPQDAGAAP
jgi:hypothetical protein